MGLPARAPPAYDSARGVSVMFEGGSWLNSSYRDDTWECHAMAFDCDCNPNDPAIRPAAAVDGMFVESLGGGAFRLTWAPAAGAASYTIIRGALSALSLTYMGDCLAGGLTSLEWQDADLPPPHDGFVYLIRGDSPVCGPGTLGFGAYGLARVDDGSGCDQP